MTSDEILTICDSVLVEGVETPEEAVRGIKRAALVISIRELESQGKGYLRMAERMRKELEKVVTESRESMEIDPGDF